MGDPLYQIKMWQIADLREAEYNPRTITNSRLEDLKRGMKADPKFIHARPLIVNVAGDRYGVIIGGHMRFKAAKALGMLEIPCVEVADETSTEEQAWNVKDNSHHGEFDRDKLAEMIVPNAIDFQSAMPTDILDRLIDDYAVADETSTEEAQTEQASLGEPISKLGDVWILGDHVLVCGDSTDGEVYQKLLNGEKADMCWTDPPYNVAYGATMKDKLRGTEDRKIANDDMDAMAFRDFLKAAMTHIIQNTKGACYVCMSSSELGAVKWAWEKAGGKWSTFIIWAKRNFTMGRSDYQRQFEPILYGKTVKTSNFEPILYGWPKEGDKEWFGGRGEGDVWFFDRPPTNPIHPTMKPVELVTKAITNSSKRGDIVIDAFGGGGSTLIACEKTSRRARVIELDPKFVDAIIARWIGHTKMYDIVRNGEAHHWEGFVVNLSGIHG